MDQLQYLEEEEEQEEEEEEEIEEEEKEGEGKEEEEEEVERVSTVAGIMGEEKNDEEDEEEEMDEQVRERGSESEGEISSASDVELVIDYGGERSCLTVTETLLMTDNDRAYSILPSFPPSPYFSPSSTLLLSSVSSSSGKVSRSEALSLLISKRKGRANTGPPHPDEAGEKLIFFFLLRVVVGGTCSCFCIGLNMN